MKKMFLGLFMAASVLATSCSDDDDSGNSGNNSRVLKYEITGNFSGTITAAYTTAAGGTTTSEITSLPWDYELTVASDVPAAAFAASGSGGTAGQEVEIKIYQGGEEVSSVEATVNSDGIFSASSPAVVF